MDRLKGRNLPAWAIAMALRKSAAACSAPSGPLPRDRRQASDISMDSYVCDQLSASGICAAGAFAHPAFLKESHFYNLERPLFLSCAEIDHTFPNEFRNRAVDIMQAEKKRFQVQLFQGVEHGFALRG